MLLAVFYKYGSRTWLVNDMSFHKINLSLFFDVIHNFQNGTKSTVQNSGMSDKFLVQCEAWYEYMYSICIVLTTRRSIYLQGAINTYTIVQYSWTTALKPSL